VETEDDCIIRKICKYAKEKINSAGCTSVDRIAYRMCDLLEYLGAKEASEEVYKYYEEDA